MRRRARAGDGPATVAARARDDRPGSPGRRWLLLEAPLGGIDRTYTAAADELRARGFAVVVAHPELAEGSVVQINAWSVAGLYGEMVRATALWLLRTAPQAADAVPNGLLEHGLAVGSNSLAA